MKYNFIYFSRKREKPRELTLDFFSETWIGENAGGRESSIFRFIIDNCFLDVSPTVSPSQTFSLPCQSLVKLLWESFDAYPTKIPLKGGDVATCFPECQPSQLPEY